MTTLESIKEYLQMLNPAELKKNLKDYREVLAGKPILPHNY